MHPLPFHQAGSWLKGNLHAHSKRSDGKWSPRKVMDYYASQDYDFLSITEHDIACSYEPRKGLIMLRGAELTVGRSLAGAPVHVLAVGLSPDIEIPKPLGGPESIEMLRESKAFCFLAHPHWSGMTSEEVAAYHICHGMEVYNAGCDYESASGLGAVHWDQMLASGNRPYGLACDDSHFALPDHGKAWIWACCRERTAEAVLFALFNGLFYSSSGPLIHDLKLAGRSLEVRCSPARAVYWVGKGRMRWGKVASPGSSLTRVKLEIDPSTPYFRVEVWDLQGRTAWSQPYFF